MTYLQVSGGKTLGFTMEYQERGVDNHYRAARDDFSLKEWRRPCPNFTMVRLTGRSMGIGVTSRGNDSPGAAYVLLLTFTILDEAEAPESE